MSRIRMALTGLVMAAGLLIPAGIASAATSAPAHTAAAATAQAAPQIKKHGCPNGDACMYTRGGWNRADPEHIYTHDGCYKLTKEYGYRIIYNLQRGEYVRLYTSSNCGHGLTYVVPPGQADEVYITPINSLSLEP